MKNGCCYDISYTVYVYVHLMLVTHFDKAHNTHMGKYHKISRTTNSYYKHTNLTPYMSSI